jgi:hypothetical protein
MALLQDKLFIVWEQFSTYKDISEHMDETLMKASIRESQLADLQPFVGPELYLILQNDFTAPDTWATPIYQELFEGSDYTNGNASIRQHGLQPMLALFAYSRMLDNLQLSVSRGGPVMYLEEDTSQPTTQAQIKTKVINARATAILYQEEVAEFLANNRSVYPEWRDRSPMNKTFDFIKL